MDDDLGAEHTDLQQCQMILAGKKFETRAARLNPSRIRAGQERERLFIAGVHVEEYSRRMGTSVGDRLDDYVELCAMMEDEINLDIDVRYDIMLPGGSPQAEQHQ